MRLDAALFTGSWQGPGSTTNFLTAGNFGSPQMELKLNFNAKKWSAYIVGHFDKKNLAPVNVVAKDSTLTGLAAEFGAKYHFGSGKLLHRQEHRTGLWSDDAGSEYYT